MRAAPGDPLPPETFALPTLPPVLPLMLLLVTLALSGFVRGFSGFGGALIAVPIGSAILGPQVTVAVLALADFVLTLPMLPPAFRRADWKTVLPAALAAIVTVPAGAYILAHADPTSLRWALSIIVALMLMLLMSGWRYRGTPRAAISAVIGAIAGVFGGAAGIAGPPVITYWMSGPADKSVLRANLIAFFTFTAVAGLASYLTAGLFTSNVMVLAVLSAPVYGVAVWLGVRMQHIASEKQFRAVAYTLIALAALIGLPALDPWLRAH